MGRRKLVYIGTRITPENFAEFEKWRKKLGQDKSGFAALCIQAGLKSVVRGVQPEAAMDDATVQRMFDIAMKHPAFKTMLKRVKK